MNALKKTLGLAVAAIALSGAAAAQAAVDNPNALPPFQLGTPMTSQQVAAELAQARAAGLTDVRPNDLPRLQRGTPMTRAQVQAEYERARAAGEIERVTN